MTDLFRVLLLCCSRIHRSRRILLTCRVFLLFLFSCFSFCLLISFFFSFGFFLFFVFFKKSNYGPIMLQKVSKRFEERGTPLAIAQIQYSLLTYKDGAKDMNEVCSNLNCRLISYSPLCLGLLTGKYTIDNLPKPGNPRRQLFKELLPGAQGLLNTLQVVSKEYGKSQTQVAINWAICKGTVPIPGARTIEQAKENLGSTGWSLRSDAIEELDRAALQVSKPMIQNIFQTK